MCRDWAANPQKYAIKHVLLIQLEKICSKPNKDSENKSTCV